MPRVVLAADLTNTKDILTLVQKVLGHFDILKLHCDIIDDFSLEFATQLRLWANQYNFKIWEDRKFSDIGSVVQKQITHGLFRFHEWVDFISVHTISGHNILNSIRPVCKKYDIQVILIVELSCLKHLMNVDYQKRSVEIADEYQDIVYGIVAQHKVSHRFFHFVPGVSLKQNAKPDLERHRPPEELAFADYLVIGREIYDSPKPLEVIKRFNFLK